MPTTTSHQTILRNVSGSTKFFDFIGQHGATLEDDEDVYITGRVEDLWQKDTKKIAAYKYALENGLITVIKSPSVFCYDETGEKVLTLGADDGDPVATAADFGSYEGAAPE